MFEGVHVVVVVPAFGEAPRIARVLQTMPGCVDRVIVVDDASRDGTAGVAKSAGGGRVEVVSHLENKGVGAAIVTGYRRAMELTSRPNDAFVVMAGDGQMAPGDLPALVGPIARGHAAHHRNRLALSRRAMGSLPLQPTEESKHVDRTDRPRW